MFLYPGWSLRNHCETSAFNRTLPPAPWQYQTAELLHDYESSKLICELYSDSLRKDSSKRLSVQRFNWLGIPAQDTWNTAATENKNCMAHESQAAVGMWSSLTFLRGSTVFIWLKTAVIYLLCLLPFWIRMLNGLWHRSQQFLNQSPESLQCCFFQVSLQSSLTERGLLLVYAQIYRASEHWDVGLRDQSPLKIWEHTGPGLLEEKVTCQ